MKYILFFDAFSVSFQSFAQENDDAKPKVKIFFRLYIHINQKSGKGHLLFINDSAIQISRGTPLSTFRFEVLSIR